MSFRRRGMSRAMALRPVNSLKHIVDTNGAVSAALPSTTDVMTAVDDPAFASPNQVATTSLVKSIFLRVDVVGTASAGGVDNIYMIVFKNPANDLPIPPANAVGPSDKRKFVIHQEMIMLSPPGTDNLRFPRTLFKGVIRIPQPYQRNGISDKLQVILQHRAGEVTQLTEFCLQCIYKEFR